MASPVPDGPFSWLSEFLPEACFVLLMAVLLSLVFWLRKREEAEWTRALESLAPTLGLHREAKFSFAGEHRGRRMMMGIRVHNVRGGKRRSYLTLRVLLEEELPQGFVAYPRQWANFVSPFFDGIFKAGDARLDERLVFQCGDAARGQRLVMDPAVREALARLGGGDAMGYIHEGEVVLAFTSQTPEEAALHTHADELIAVETALRAAHASMDSSRG